MAEQQREIVQGTIERLHPSGTRFKLAGHPDYVQLSRWPDEGTVIPPVGTKVQLQLDRTGFVRAIVNISGPDVVTGPQNRQQGPFSPPMAPNAIPSRRDAFLRTTALRCSVDLLAGTASPPEPEAAIALAERFLSWLALHDQPTASEDDFRV